MAVRRSAGLLVFRTSGGRLEVLVAHMGGPYWAARDAGAWTVPKGEYAQDETALAAARREFVEELGLPVPDGEPVPLGEARQAGGKVVSVWAVEGDLDPALVVPGTFTVEWPRGSGAVRTFPEVDRVEWCTPREAAERLVAGQRVFLERLVEHLRGRDAP
ncbi:NUDIX domain-containing protein [Streptomyces somaliensis DSM 40738]|uniref:NUDIX domain-containing protein n=1 Tax=Streptomyces somaliensis TaxID=78355 RepID=UPI0021C41A5E|nr:NUDIX domain-containing protein [Streptomyces somaliensis]MCQ0021591.1 NUDIX domain-containing protein [Streptomyces somaliensis DSM 40738]